MAKRARLTEEDAQTMLSALDRFIDGKPGEGRVAAREIAVELIRPNPIDFRGTREAGDEPEPDRLDAELEESIREFGVLQPILVQRTGSLYQVVAGERRFRAAVRAGLLSVPCTLLQPADEEEAKAIFFAENMCREQLVESGESMRQPLGGSDQKQENVEVLEDPEEQDLPEGQDPEGVVPEEQGRREFPIDQGSINSDRAGVEDIMTSDSPQDGAEEGHKVGDESTEQTRLERSLDEAREKIAAFLQSAEDYGIEGGVTPEQLAGAVADAKCALEKVQFAVLHEPGPEEARLTAELAELRRQQQEIRQALRQEFARLHPGGIEPRPPLPEQPAVPLKEIEARRAALLQEIKGLVEYRQQLRQQLEGLLGQMAAPASTNAAKPAPPQEGSSVLVEEITGACLDGAQRHLDAEQE